MKLRLSFALRFSFLGVVAVAASTLLAGCDYLKAPAPEVLPPKPKPPKPGVFDPTLYNISGVKLNAPNDPKLPEYFEVVRIYSGNLFWVRSADIVAAPTPAPPKKGVTLAKSAAVKPTPAPAPTSTPATPKITYGAPEIVRLAGVSVPLPGQPGAAEAISTLTHWTMGRKLTLEQDPSYPFDFDQTDLNSLGIAQARRVQVFFEGGGASNDKNGKSKSDQKQSLNLNRLMIRSGYAVVNQYAPTIFDTKGWLNDEQYARQNKLGLWKMGIVLNGRQPPPGLPGQKSGAPGTANATTNATANSTANATATPAGASTPAPGATPPPPAPVASPKAP